MVDAIQRSLEGVASELNPEGMSETEMRDTFRRLDHTVDRLQRINKDFDQFRAAMNLSTRGQVVKWAAEQPDLCDWELRLVEGELSDCRDASLHIPVSLEPLDTAPIDLP